MAGTELHCLIILPELSEVVALYVSTCTKSQVVSNLQNRRKTFVIRWYFLLLSTIFCSVLLEFIDPSK